MRTALVVFLIVGLAGTAAGAANTADTSTFILERLNGTYTDLGGDIAEIRNGPITVRPATPTNRFQLIKNSLELTPLGDGVHRADFFVQFEGEAEVTAEILMGGFSASQLEDEVLVPNQSKKIRTHIRMAPQGDGYLITIVESPDIFEIRVESRLAGQLVSMCESFARFTFSKCDGLEAALSNPNVPMPEPGDEFELDGDQLTLEEKQQLDDYLARAN